MTKYNNTQQYTTTHIKMNPAKLLPLLTFGLLFVAFALASNANSTNSKNSNNISNTYCDNTTDAETCDAVAMLKAKREMSDAPTLLMYLAIAAIIVIPQIPQIDV
jgi:uncharacterized membrane protein (DUF4010 family)